MTVEDNLMIGLEIHASLNTKSKLFCSCSTDDEHAEANSLCCPICLGHPGSKPVLNEVAVDLALSIGLALNCKINTEFFFSRKTYFYPDMSMNYQITQYEVPVAENGYLEVNGQKIRIKRVHIEWDPAALIHPEGMGKSSYTLIDYNRSGQPLVEIVTQPDLTSPAQAREFMKTLENVLSYLKVLKSSSSIKADCNISIQGGNRVEIKNVSGFASVEKALSYELSRQKNELKMGRKIEQHTRAFSADTGVTTELRKKETEDDYGYIFDPDLVKVSLEEKYVEGIKSKMPELPEIKVKRFQTEFGLSEYDSKVLCADYELGALFEKLTLSKVNPKLAANLLTRELLAIMNHDSLYFKDLKIDEKHLIDLLKLAEQGKVSDKNIKQSMINYISGDKVPPVDYLEKNNLLISQSIDLGKVIENIVQSNEKAVLDYKSGNEKSFNFLAGLIMRETKGTVSPAKVNEELKVILSK